MAEINDILERFTEETYANSYFARLVNGEIISVVDKRRILAEIPSINNYLSDYFDDIGQEQMMFKKGFENLLQGMKGLKERDKEKTLQFFKNPIYINFEEIKGREILASINEKPIRIKLEGEFIDGLIKLLENSKPIKHLFWITIINEKHLELKLLKCGYNKKFAQSLNIRFGDNIILNFKGQKIDDISRILEDDFIYKNQGSDIIFLQKYSGNADTSFTMYGKNKRANIKLIDNQWFISKIINTSFPKKHTDFMDLDIEEYLSISFIESSKAKEAFNTIQTEEIEGKTLISLWQKYSEIELKRSEQLKFIIGELRFQIVRHLREGITRIQILDLNEKLRTSISEFKDDLIRASIEVKFLTANDDSESIDKREIFNIKSISDDYKIDLFDELNIIPHEGIFSISIIGDETVNKRRIWALKSLKENSRFLTRNLLLAIEGFAESMLEKKRNETSISQRTRAFIKSRFGIDNLTENQEKAIAIAVETPDIAIVQGPPGTGKSMIIAAVCDRLIEIAEKRKGEEKSNDKLILVSAFQNDTVEDIASKIYTMGLPTIKIGKQTQGNIRAEDKLIEDMKFSIDAAIKTLSVTNNSFRIPKRLADIRKVFMTEMNIIELRNSLDELGIFNKLSDTLLDDWQEIANSQKLDSETIDKIRIGLQGLPTEINSYNEDNGYYKIRKIQKLDISLTNEEKQLLSIAPIDNPSKDFLEKLSQLRHNHLSAITKTVKDDASEDYNNLLDWLSITIKYFSELEETSYQDEQTFILSNLESIRDEFDGNAAFIRDSIKNYGESLAATNQASGSKEISSYNNIENVILEEAARSNPLDLLIPMSKATERIIMVGDQNQLPHILENDIADETVATLSDDLQNSNKREQLEHALFDIIFRNLSSAKPKRVITLTEQFRMHPFIGDFISRVYYKGDLKSGKSDLEQLKSHSLQVNWAKEKVAVFCNVGKDKGEEIRGKSKSRPSEAIQIIKLLDEIKTDPNFENMTVGIITFYSKQVNEIFNEAVKKGYAISNSDGTFEICHNYKKTADNREKLRIGSVDSFQGKEFDIVILSTVRSNMIPRTDKNSKTIFGFLTLKNRLNVAFSRAQKLLIVVGDGEMFSDGYAKLHVEGLYEFYTNLSCESRYGNRI